MSSEVFRGLQRYSDVFKSLQLYIRHHSVHIMESKPHSSEQALDKYHCADYDNAYGPKYVDGRWTLGHKNLRFEDQYIGVDNVDFKSTLGLLELLFSKNPRNYTPLDHQMYKQMLEISSIHRDRLGRLRGQADKEKFDKIIRPLFKNKTKPKRPKSSVEPEASIGNEEYNILDEWTDPNILVDRLRYLMESDKNNNEIAFILTELENVGIISKNK